jgi:hypothetical protein
MVAGAVMLQQLARGQFVGIHVSSIVCSSVWIISIQLPKIVLVVL